MPNNNRFHKEVKMPFTGDYARFYSDIYSDKDYQGEANFLDEVLSCYGNGGDRLLDVGCGIGNHANELFQKGYRVTGIDISEDMIQRAKDRYSFSTNISFAVSDAANFSSDKKFDVVSAIFNVVGYFTNDEQLNNIFNNFYSLLNKNGLLVFDCWHTPAVYADLPTIREKKFKVEGLTIERRSIPHIRLEESCIDIVMDIYEILTSGESIKRTSEMHSVRFFTQNELIQILDRTGFELLCISKWQNLASPPDIKSYDCFVVARKRG